MIAVVFNRYWATRTVTLYNSKAFDRVWQAGLLHELNSYGISKFSFLSNRPLWIFLDWRSSQEYQINVGVSQCSIFGPTLSYYTLIVFLMML